MEPLYIPTPAPKSRRPRPSALHFAPGAGGALSTPPPSATASAPPPSPTMPSAPPPSATTFSAPLPQTEDGIVKELEDLTESIDEAYAKVLNCYSQRCEFNFSSPIFLPKNIDLEKKFEVISHEFPPAQKRALALQKRAEELLAALENLEPDPNEIDPYDSDYENDYTRRREATAARGEFKWCMEKRLQALDLTLLTIENQRYTGVAGMIPHVEDVVLRARSDATDITDERARNGLLDGLQKLLEAVYNMQNVYDVSAGDAAAEVEMRILHLTAARRAEGDMHRDESVLKKIVPLESVDPEAYFAKLKEKARAANWPECLTSMDTTASTVRSDGGSDHLRDLASQRPWDDCKIIYSSEDEEDDGVGSVVSVDLDKFNKYRPSSTLGSQQQQPDTNNTMPSPFFVPGPARPSTPTLMGVRLPLPPLVYPDWRRTDNRSNNEGEEEQQVVPAGTTKESIDQDAFVFVSPTENSHDPAFTPNLDAISKWLGLDDDFTIGGILISFGIQEPFEEYKKAKNYDATFASDPDAWWRSLSKKRNAGARFKTLLVLSCCTLEQLRTYKEERPETKFDAHDPKIVNQLVDLAFRGDGQKQPEVAAAAAAAAARRSRTGPRTPPDATTIAAIMANIRNADYDNDNNARGGMGTGTILGGGRGVDIEKQKRKEKKRREKEGGKEEEEEEEEEQLDYDAAIFARRAVNYLEGGYCSEVPWQKLEVSLDAYEIGRYRFAVALHMLWLLESAFM
ncbi:hypothetical protein F5Y17DRAFT_182748 [Xylariaceae sp. FL0594]|nr:hypothetical protein F5Y17DRAFT_182748 [Xylariaceae sp. FL0594]